MESETLIGNLETRTAWKKALGAVRTDRDINSHRTMRTVALRGAMYVHNRHVFSAGIEGGSERQFRARATADKSVWFRTRQTTWPT